MKLDLSYYLGGSFWLSLSRIVTAALSLLLSVLFARFTAQELYGQYKFALSVFSLLSILALPGMAQAITQSVAKGYSWSVIRGTKTKIKWSLLAWPALAGIAVYFISFKGDRIGWAVLIGISLFSLAHGFDNNAFFTGQKRFKANGIIFMCQRLIAVAMVSGSIFLFGDIVAVVTAYLLSHAILNLAIFTRITREIRGEPDQVDSGLIKYGKQLTATTILMKVAKSLDHLFIASFLGFQAVAVFAIAQAVPNAAKGSFKQISSLTLPKFTAAKTADMYKKLRFKLLQLLAIGGIATVALMIALPFFIPAVYSAKYAHSVLPAEILAISVILSPLSEVLLSALTSHKRVRELYYLRTLVPVTRIALLVLLIPFLGVTGAALSIVLSQLMGTMYAWQAVKKMAREEQAIIV